MVNYTQLERKLACMLKIYRTCNPTDEFSKYEFNNKLLVVVTIFRVTSGVTWTKPYIRNSMWILINLPIDYIIFIYFLYLQNFKVIKD